MSLADVIQVKLDAGVPASHIERMYGVRLAPDTCRPRPRKDAYVPPRPKPPVEVALTPRQQRVAMIEAIAEADGYTLADIMEDKRTRALSATRFKAMWSIKNHWPETSYPALAKLFNRSNHTTVLYGVRRHQATLEGRVYRKTRKGAP